jgi:hypothetical protein
MGKTDFKSLKEPRRPPSPNFGQVTMVLPLEIKIHHVRDAKVFYGGDNVSGFVKVAGPLKIPNATVKIGFAGSSETEQQVKNSMFIDKAVFFQTAILFNGDVDIERGDTQRWPFTFELPVKTEPAWGNARITYSEDANYAMAAHPIPPSVAISKPRWAAHVRYRLHAKLGMREHAGEVTIVPSKAQTDNGPPDAQLDVQSKVFTHVSSRLVPEQAHRRRSVNKWFSDKFASDTPRAVFSITARTAQTLIAGQDIPIQLMLVYDAEKSNLPSPPELRLLQLKYRIRARTYVLSRSRGIFSTQEKQVTACDTVFKRHLRLASLFLVNGNNLDVGILNANDSSLRHLSLDTALIPSFTTYNIRRRYEAQIAIVFECGGKQITAEFPWTQLKIEFNESYSQKPLKESATTRDKALVGAASVVKVLAATASAVAQTLL